MTNTDINNSSIKIDAEYSFRLLENNEIELFKELVENYFKAGHTYVRYPQIIDHFYSEKRYLNIYGAFRSEELIGVYPLLFYNIKKTDAAGGLFLFKPIPEKPFIGQLFLKHIIDHLDVNGLFTAGINGRLVNFFQRINHVCGKFDQYYWYPPSSPTQFDSNFQTNNLLYHQKIISSEDKDYLKDNFPKSDFLPQKDYWFFKKNYLENPTQNFEVYLSVLPKNNFVFTTASYITPIGTILRLYDFAGKSSDFFHVLNFLKEKTFKQKYTYVDVMVTGIEETVFSKIGFKKHCPISNKKVITNSFFPFKIKNSEVVYGFKLIKKEYSKNNIILFKGSGDQIIPSDLSGVDTDVFQDKNVCV